MAGMLEISWVLLLIHYIFSLQEEECFKVNTHSQLFKLGDHTKTSSTDPEAMYAYHRYPRRGWYGFLILG